MSPHSRLLSSQEDIINQPGKTIVNNSQNQTHRNSDNKHQRCQIYYLPPGDIIAELKKVVWLTRREILYLTTLVLIVAVTMGLILGVIDYGFTRLVNDIFLAG